MTNNLEKTSQNWCLLARISDGPVRNARGVPTFVGVSRELRYSSRAGVFAPGEPLPKQLATGDLLTNRKICEKFRQAYRKTQRALCS